MRGNNQPVKRPATREELVAKKDFYRHKPFWRRVFEGEMSGANRQPAEISENKEEKSKQESM